MRVGWERWYIETYSGLRPPQSLKKSLKRKKKKKSSKRSCERMMCRCWWLKSCWMRYCLIGRGWWHCLRSRFFGCCCCCYCFYWPSSLELVVRAAEYCCCCCCCCSSLVRWYQRSRWDNCWDPSRTLKADWWMYYCLHHGFGLFGLMLLFYYQYFTLKYPAGKWLPLIISSLECNHSPSPISRQLL